MSQDLFTATFNDKPSDQITGIIQAATKAIAPIKTLSEFDRIIAINAIREEIHKLSPFAKEPVDFVRWVPADLVAANDYNPNSVAPPEMKLLEHSIWEDGYTQPIVTFYEADQDRYVVVDGFHRYLTMKNSARIRERERGLLPVVVIDKEMGERMASTIRHNRARGTHNVELMSAIVAELVEMGKGDRWICKHIGMSADELLRLKQITGLAALFANREFSESWTADVDESTVEFESVGDE